MDILVIGGTRFLGSHFVEAALRAGHRLTLFNRGQSGPGLFPEAEHVRGDRDGGLTPLEGRRWDAVLDTCGYVPRVVRASAELLAPGADHYTFVSSLSVFPDGTPPGYDETAPVDSIDDPSIEEITNESYGPLKALCEAEVEQAFPGRALVVRPGLIVGPRDPTDRFTYWPWRVARGGEVLAPAPPGYRIQIIDGRDLAGWMLRMIEGGGSGVYNATGPTGILTLGELLDACARVSGSGAAITPVDAGFLEEHDVEPWSDVPVWMPGQAYEGFMAADCSKAIATGLTFRPIEDTIGDTLAWASARPGDHEMKAGLTPVREAALLRAWHERGPATADPGTGTAFR
jgi:2'-hydroxyisoflavone reductase